MTHRAIIVDDERLARRELRTLLAVHPDIDVVGDAATLAEARALLARAEPDVVFLDVQLGRATGFDLLDAMPEDVSVIFVTAYDRHAMRAFEVNALDYLLKPVEPSRLRRAIEKLSQGRGPSTAASGARLTSAVAPADWLFLRSGERRAFVKVQSVTYLEADGDYVTVHTIDGRAIRTNVPLSTWQQRLPGSFLRIQRSLIVNLEYVTGMEPWSHYSYRITLRGIDKALIMSRRYAARAKELLG